MVMEFGALDATLAAAAGEDIALIAELRAAFVESATKQVDLLERSRCDGNWRISALRLRGLSASFHAEKLMKLADEALEAAPGEPTVIRSMRKFLQEFSAD